MCVCVCVCVCSCVCVCVDVCGWMFVCMVTYTSVRYWFSLTDIFSLTHLLIIFHPVGDEVDELHPVGNPHMISYVEVNEESENQLENATFLSLYTF